MASVQLAVMRFIYNSVVAGLIAEVFLVLLFICNAVYQLYNEAEQLIHLLLIYSQGTCLVTISRVTGLIAEVFLILFFFCNGWNKAENKAEWPHHFPVPCSQARVLSIFIICLASTILSFDVVCVGSPVNKLYYKKVNN